MKEVLNDPKAKTLYKQSQTRRIYLPNYRKQNIALSVGTHLILKLYCSRSHVFVCLVQIYPNTPMVTSVQCKYEEIFFSTRCNIVPKQTSARSVEVSNLLLNSTRAEIFERKYFSAEIVETTFNCTEENFVIYIFKKT